jgi:hypothetical protein
MTLGRPIPKNQDQSEDNPNEDFDKELIAFCFLFHAASLSQDSADSIKRNVGQRRASDSLEMAPMGAKRAIF